MEFKIRVDNSDKVIFEALKITESLFSRLAISK